MMIWLTDIFKKIKLKYSLLRLFFLCLIPAITISAINANAYINFSQNVSCANVDEALGNLDIEKICGNDADCIKQAQKRLRDLQDLKRNCDDAKKIVDSGRESVKKNADIVMTSDSFVETGVSAATVAVQGVLSEGTNAVTKTMTALSGYDSNKTTTVNYIADSNMTFLSVDKKLKELEKRKSIKGEEEKTKLLKEEAKAKLEDFKQHGELIKKAFPNSMATIDKKADDATHWYNHPSRNLEIQADYNNDVINMLQSQADSGNPIAGKLLEQYKEKQAAALKANSAFVIGTSSGGLAPAPATPGNLGASTARYDAAQKQNANLEANLSKEDLEKAKKSGLYDTTDEQLEDARRPEFDKKCNIAAMQKTYQSKCYSCVIVKTLIETFMSACATAYDATSEAGVKLLTLGALIWMAFFVMKNVSSLANVEPGAMVNTLAVFLFKVMVAYIFITSGLGVLVKYFVNPFLTAGADFGMALMATTGDISGAVNPEYTIKMATVTAEGGKAATEIVSADVINKIMLFTQSLDKTVSTHLVVGHAITCHSMTAGAWDLHLIKLVNLWLWFCGALIWFVGFMLTLGICYYLLDISFKLGFAIMALPVVIGLWPFNITKGKVTAVFSIVLKSGATFAFLALTTTFALVLVSQALRDIPTLLDKITKEETRWIADTFNITGPYFLIILFAYLYSMKLISATVDDYVNKFFGDNVFGNESPMHKMSTQMTDFAKDKVMGIGKGIGNKAGEALKEEAKEKVGTAKKFVKGLFKGKANDDTESDKGGAGGAVKGGGQAVKAGGATVEKTGQAMEQSGKVAEQGGKAAAAGGKGMMSGGKGMMRGGAALSATGLGAIVGVPMMIAGAAVTAAGAGTYAAGKAVEVSGKVAQKAGKAMKKGGKAMKKAGEKIEKAGEKMEKVGDKLKFGDRKPAEAGENKPDDKPRSVPTEEPQPEPEPEPAPQPTPTPAPETPPAETK